MNRTPHSLVQIEVRERAALGDVNRDDILRRHIRLLRQILVKTDQRAQNTDSDENIAPDAGCDGSLKS